MKSGLENILKNLSPGFHPGLLMLTPQQVRGYFSTFQPFFCNSSSGFDSFRKNDEISAKAPMITKNFIRKGR